MKNGPESGGRITRRSFLDRLRNFTVGAAAASAMPHELTAAPGHEGVEPIDPKDAEFFQSLLSNNKVYTDFREKPTAAQIGRVVRHLARVSTKEVAPIAEQIGRLYPGARVIRDANENHVGNGTVLRIRDPRQVNAYRYVLVTAAHVAKKAAEVEGSRWVQHPSQKIDVAVRELTQVEIAELPVPEVASLPFDISPESERNISGKVGIVLGRDSDSGPMLKKAYPSLVSPRVTEQFFYGYGSTPESLSDLVQKSEFRLMVLPPDQYELMPNDVDVAMNGMSGSAFVFLSPEADSVTLEGIFISADPIKSRGITYVVGHIADRSQIRETIEYLFMNPDVDSFETNTQTAPGSSTDRKKHSSR